MRAHNATLLAAIAASCLHPVASFAPPHVVAGIAVGAPVTPCDGDARGTVLSAAGPPVISNWRYDPSGGTVSGTVTNHPTIRDGDRITTSPVKNANGLDENVVVQTKSGSRYKLTNAAFGAKVPVVEAKRAAEKKAAAEKKRLAEEQRAAAAEKKRATEEKKSAAAAAKRASVAASKKATTARATSATRASPVAALAAPQISPAALRKLAKSTFSLTGTSVGAGGKYLLAGRPAQSSGRAAKIWTAYLADPENLDVPAGFAEAMDASAVKKLKIKLSPDLERLRLENSNYDKVQSGIFSGRFVKKMDYVQYVPSSNRALNEKVSALVIEAGRYDLKALLAARNGAPLRGRALRDAAASAGQCIQAIHSSGLVWTDLKTENFVVVRGDDNFDAEVMDDGGGMGLPGVKGIDLESVIARGGNPIDYSPEACPPEFARAFMGGYGEDFVLDYSYDIWSLGMMMYELSTGVPYFERKSPSAVTKMLCDDAFEADVSLVPDTKLRDLIGKCLSLEPGRRPDITGFLLHPYFITTGFGPISF